MVRGGMMGRWWAVDPLAHEYYNFSPFSYGFNNPIYFVDSDGLRVSLFDRMEDTGAYHGEDVDDYYVFDENGYFIRKEENNDPDQVVIENSQTSNRKHIAFSDTEHDVSRLEAAIDFHGDDIMHINGLEAITRRILVQIGKRF